MAPAKSKNNSELEVVEGVEFICEDPPHSKAQPRKFTITKNGNADESFIGSKLLERAKVIAAKHAILKFKGTKVFISDAKSKHGTWIDSEGMLISGKDYLLKDGGTIVFGAKDDKLSKNPDAVRTKIKILRPESKLALKPILKVTGPPLDSKLDIPKVAGKRSVTPDSLKPPETDVKKHRRTVSLELPSKGKQQQSGKPDPKPKVSSAPDTPKPDAKKQRRASSLNPPTKKDKRSPSPKPAPQNPPKKKSVSTELQREVKIPWSDTFRLGFGVDALTGESMTCTALSTFRMPSHPPRPKEARVYVDTLHWNAIKSLKDQYDIEIGGTVNVAPASISMDSRISSLLSKNASLSTVLIQYQVNGEFEPEFIPASVTLQEGMPGLTEAEFRERYGDYYLAGRQRGYGCRMVVVCQINDKSITKKHEIKAQTLVKNFFKASGTQSKVKSQSKKCSIVHVMIETYGCSEDAAYLSNDLLSPQDAQAALPKLLANPKGTTRSGILYHYSSLMNCSLPRRITVHQDVFAKIHKMRDICLDLQTYLEHPALQSDAYTTSVKSIRSAITAFQTQRKNLVRKLTLEKKIQHADIYVQMVEAKLKADGMMKCYDFIAAVKGMDRAWKKSVKPGPAGAGAKETQRHTFIWECGKVGGKFKKKLANYNQVVFGAGFEAYELGWESPLTTPPNPLKKMLGKAGYPEHMNLVQMDPVEVSGKKGRVVKEGEEVDGGFFNFQLAGGKIYVVGWTLSCVWDGKPDPGPVIELDDGDNNLILSDQFTVKLDMSRPTRWKCKVTFVFQAHHQFPDLKLEERNNNNLKEPDLD
ncbi:hypothetical protein GYMLUDRAFT_72518 [Collybiopsis luxurians FD-317 M1]|uniref:FHA domain-containing protein n=1 Tax=Collybiopsis luxurians FD-317 M1 TaxID=944289 RepID=A0A0D0CTK2_9AGAR|nr:hypothetical protein GYMLUDRAFT_72518 [Collybiopsis luxurians FD-317 M1]